VWQSSAPHPLKRLTLAKARRSMCEGFATDRSHTRMRKWHPRQLKMKATPFETVCQQPHKNQALVAGQHPCSWPHATDAPPQVTVARRHFQRTDAAQHTFHLLYSVCLCTCTTAAVANSGFPLKHRHAWHWWGYYPLRAALLPITGTRGTLSTDPLTCCILHPCRLHHIWNAAHEVRGLLLTRFCWVIRLAAVAQALRWFSSSVM
jgi:hypothetical protein